MLLILVIDYPASCRAIEFPFMAVLKTVRRALFAPARWLRWASLRTWSAARSYPWVASTFMVSIVAMIVAAVVSYRVGVPLRDPEGSIVGKRMMLPFIFMGIMIMADTAVGAYRSRSQAGQNAGTYSMAFKQHFAERWWWHRIIIAIIGFMSFALAYLAYRNLKSYVMLVDPRTWDQELLKVDRVMAFGHSPAELLHHVLGTDTAATLLSAIYLSYIPLVPLSVAVALAFARDIRDGYIFVCGSIYCWILGTISYYMIPSLGPFGGNPRLFANLPETGVTRVQNALIDHRLRLWHDPLGFDNVSSIGGFASLHVGVVFMAMIVAWQFRMRITLAILTLYFVPTVIATIYFGWHYIVDDIAGLFIGWFSVVSARWTVYPRMPWRRVRVEPVDA